MKWAVTFTARPLYPREKCPRHLLDWSLGGPQNWSKRCGVEINLSALPGLEPGRPARSSLLYHWAKAYILRFPRRWLLRLWSSGLWHRADTDVSERHRSGRIKMCITNSLRPWRWKYHILGTQNCYNPERHNPIQASFSFLCLFFFLSFFLQEWFLYTAHTSGWSGNWNFRIAVSTITSWKVI
jgi:hypothetical protein